MDITRNQYFGFGLVILFLGLQFRLIDSVVLTPKCTRMLAEASNNQTVAAADTLSALAGTESPLPPKNVRPPDWLGWALTSFGSVLILHALAMRKQG